MLSEPTDFVSYLNRVYLEFKEPSFINRLIKHKNLISLLNSFNEHSVFEIEKIGQSFQNREIYSVKVGSGPMKIMLWSQMHGDEPTATMAIIDILNYFLDATDPTKEAILRSTTLYFIPMVNPDGAEAFTRTNSVGIDINRDAIRLQSPEAKILKEFHGKIKPHFAFNLHDQSKYYSVGNTGVPATLSFLAPPFNKERDVNEVRKRAMQVISALQQQLKPLLPGKIAKFSDEFEPRSIGDNMQMWETSTVLIESGHIIGDAEKQALRRFTFIAILCSIEILIDRRYKDEDIASYYAIPNNVIRLYDLIIRNMELRIGNKSCIVDMGINLQDKIDKDFENFSTIATIEEVGDLSNYYGFEEINAQGMQVLIGSDSREEAYRSPVHIGGNILINKLPSDFDRRQDSRNKNLLSCLLDSYWQPITTLKPNMTPRLILISNNLIRYIILDDGLYKLDT